MGEQACHVGSKSDSREGALPCLVKAFGAPSLPLRLSIRPQVSLFSIRAGTLSLRPRPLIRPRASLFSIRWGRSYARGHAKRIGDSSDPLAGSVSGAAGAVPKPQLTPKIERAFFSRSSVSSFFCRAFCSSWMAERVWWTSRRLKTSIASRASWMTSG